MHKEREENEKGEEEEASREKGKAEEERKVDNEKVEEEASSEDKPTESAHDDTIGNMDDSSLNEVRLVFDFLSRCLYIGAHLVSSVCLFVFFFIVCHYHPFGRISK